MDAVWFWMGQYMLQSLLHALIAALVVEILLYLWDEHRPEVKLRFLLLVLLIPVLSFPLFQWMNPQRGAFRFRMETALFDSTLWLQLRLWNHLMLWHVGLAFLAIASAFFLVQDAGPIVFPYFHRNVRKIRYGPGTFPAMDQALARLEEMCLAIPPVCVLPVREPLLYTDGIGKGAINISQPLIETLDSEELEAVLAHEMAHLQRKDNAIGWLLLALRFLILFNPVALIEFRRMIHEREKLCDDLGARLTGKPVALASSLAKVFRIAQAGAGGSRLHQLELHSQRVRIEDRVRRLLKGNNRNGPLLPHARLGLTACALLLLLFFVV